MPAKMSVRRRSDRVNFGLRKSEKRKMIATIRAINGLFCPKEIIWSINPSRFKVTSPSRLTFPLNTIISGFRYTDYRKDQPWQITL